MKRLLRIVSGVMAGSFWAWAGSARAADPCDFASGGESAFPYARVRACYEQVPFSADDLRNTVDVIRQHRSFSDLSEIYDARVHWQRELRAVEARQGEQAFPNDLAMQDAFKREHKNFKDEHVSYVPPACYWRMLNAFIPLDFGAAIVKKQGRREQVIFVEDAPILPDLYLAATGIDARAYVGQRVLSINGVPVLDYFRHYAEQQRTHEDAGGGLNGVLTAFEYSVRLGGPSDFVPDRAADTLRLESIDGQVQTVELPWLFVRSSELLGDLALPPTPSTEAFVNLCEQGPPEAAGPAAGVARLASSWGLRGGDEVDPERRQMLRRLGAHHPMRPAPQAFYEVPPERLGQGIVEVIPATNNARVIQYGEGVTAIQLGDTVGWIDVARQGVEYACEHSERLILDLRDNGGGNDTVIRWLHHYLFPEAGNSVQAGLLPLRVRNDNAVFDEVLSNFAQFTQQYLPALGLPACTLFMVPGCLLDVDTGTALPADEWDWFLSPTHRERRAGQKLALSRQIALPNIGDPVFDSASCAGRFSGDDLVLLTNGSNASGGYFLPAAFKGDGVIVNTGGLLGEAMAMGRARGGATVPGSLWPDAAQAIELISEGQIRFRNPIIAFRRPVDTQMEMLGAYRKDRTTLHIEDPVEADLHVDVWTSLPGSEGFVYERVLRAVDE